MPRLPLIPTIVVAAACATMAALGIWQLQRAEWKQGLLDRYATNMTLSSTVEWPRAVAEPEAGLYRKSSVTCERVSDLRAVAGRSAEGRTGWMHVADCETAAGGEAQVALGWSNDPYIVDWSGGEVSGTVAPAGESVRLVADRPVAGLAPLAPPDPNDLPNNHLGYAFQWFFFALTAAVVYILALRRREKGG